MAVRDDALDVVLSDVHVGCAATADTGDVGIEVLY